MTKISPELTELMESGVSILVGTRDAKLRPECVRAVGARIHAGGESLTVYLPEAVALRTLKNLDDNGQVAVTFSRPIDHRTIQVKGTCLGVRPAGEEDRLLQEDYLAALREQLQLVGLPRVVTRRMRWWPSVAVRVSVRELFQQTPGPQAGARLSA